MSLPHAILGLLNILPMTGYELKHAAFDRTIAHFWQADQAQIYRTLGSMAEQGWVESTLEIQQDRPNRKVYRITPAGQEELRRWLKLEQPLPVYREPFMLQLFFAGDMDPQEILKHIERHREGHQARLAHYQQIAIQPTGDAEFDRRRAFWRLTLEMGIAMEQTYLTWLDHCDQVVRAQTEKAALAAP